MFICNNKIICSFFQASVGYLGDTARILSSTNTPNIWLGLQRDGSVSGNYGKDPRCLLQTHWGHMPDSWGVRPNLLVVLLSLWGMAEPWQKRLRRLCPTRTLLASSSHVGVHRRVMWSTWARLAPLHRRIPTCKPSPPPGKGISRKEQRCPSISCVRRRPAACCMHPSCGQGYNVPACFLLSVLWHWTDHPRLLAFTPLGCHGVPSPLGTVVKCSRNSTLCIRNPLLATLWEYFPTWGHRGRSRTLGVRKFNEISFLNSDRHLGYQERQTNPHPGKLESGWEQGVCHTALEFYLAFPWVQLGFWKWEPVTKLSCKLNFNWNCLFLNGSFSAEPEAHGCRLSVQEAGARRGIPWQFKTSQIHRLSSA